MQSNPSIDVKRATPQQEYYLPLEERDVFHNLFRAINNGSWYGQKYVRGYMVSMVSVTISTDYTVLWVDQFEDGYEADPEFKTFGSTTKVWGDGDASNGCAPNVVTCEDQYDYLMAGDSFVVKSQIDTDIERDQQKVTEYLLDGGDRIAASFPVAITRGEYAEHPGSLLAGAVEVHELSNWGKLCITRLCVVPIEYVLTHNVLS